MIFLFYEEHMLAGSDGLEVIVNYLCNR